MDLVLPFETYPSIDTKIYMEAFEPLLSSSQILLLRAAYAFSKEGHRRQQRDDGHRYFDHVRACSWIAANEMELFDIDLHCSLLLHDIIEDTHLLTVPMIERFFGERVAIYVNLMTHRPNVPVDVYVNTLRRSGRARAIGGKLIDRIHNLRTLGGCTIDKRNRKLKETIELYVPLAEQLVAKVSPRYKANAVYLHEQLLQVVEYWSACPGA